MTGIAARKDELANAVAEVCAINLDDGLAFSLAGITNIADHNGYPGFRAELLAEYGRMKTRLTIDITTGDKITPAPVELSLPLLFEDRAITVRAYTLETLIAEKLQTILVRGVLNTRPRDFYDIYLVVKRAEEEIRSDVLGRAIDETFSFRNTLDLLARKDAILKEVADSSIMPDTLDGLPTQV